MRMFNFIMSLIWDKLVEDGGEPIVEDGGKIDYVLKVGALKDVVDVHE